MIKEKESVELLIIPTSGLVPLSNWLPDNNGQARLLAASKLIEKDFEGRFLAIIGNYAEKYYKYCITLYPHLEKKIAFYDSSAKMSNRDVEAAWPKIEQFIADQDIPRFREHLGVVSYERHSKRIEKILRAIGFRNIVTYDSGETPIYPKWKEGVLDFVTNHDTFCKHIGLPLVWLANRRK